jgi:CRP-like cAMP-binding protein
MSDQSLTDIFASHAFLKDLSERYRMLLASGVRPFTAAPKDTLAKEGEPAKTFFLVQSGHVELAIPTPDRGLVPIQTVGPGEVVGWSWLVPPHIWQFDCRAVDAVQGLKFDAEWLRLKCAEDHELGYLLFKQLLTVLANRLAATRLQLLDIYK